MYLGVGGNTNGLVAVGSGGLISFSPASFPDPARHQSTPDGTLKIDARVTNVFSSIGIEWTESTSPKP